MTQTSTFSPCYGIDIDCSGLFWFFSPLPSLIFCSPLPFFAFCDRDPPLQRDASNIQRALLGVELYFPETLVCNKICTITSLAAFSYSLLNPYMATDRLIICHKTKINHLSFWMKILCFGVALSDLLCVALAPNVSSKMWELFPILLYQQVIWNWLIPFCRLLPTFLTNHQFWSCIQLSEISRKLPMGFWNWKNMSLLPVAGFPKSNLPLSHLSQKYLWTYYIPL